MAEEYIGSVTVLKAGNILRVTIPKALVERMGIKEGEKLLVYFDKEKNVIILKRP